MNMPEHYSAHLQTPVGSIEVCGSELGITSINFVERPSTDGETHPCLHDALLQLEEYFSGARREFLLQLAPQGTEFEQQVWGELAKIPFGKRASYLDIAERLGNPKSVRAVGLANGRNPIAIVVPCHRVVGSDGSLTGYAGGLWRKQWLLDHEGGNVQGRLEL